MNDIYSEDWRITDEMRELDDGEHRIMKELNLTVAGCNCRRCCDLRDYSVVAMSPFGKEDERALKAMDRMNQRRSTTTAASA